jgi:hypothetical protein
LNAVKEAATLAAAELARQSGTKQTIVANKKAFP